MNTYYISDYLTEKLLDHVLKVATYTPPSEVFLGLVQEDITELSGAYYERQRVPFDSASVGSGWPRTFNSQSLQFPISRSNWDRLDDFYLYDAREGGNQLFYVDAEDSGSYIEPAMRYSIPAGEIEIRYGGEVSNALAKALLDFALRGVTLDAPEDIYVILCSALPSVDGSFTEITSGGYSRAIHNSWNANIPGEVHGAISINDGPISFGTATEDWDAPAAFALLDQDDNLLFFGDIEGTTGAISTNDTFVILDQQLVITMNGG